jgi:hypothetical protein
VTAVLLVTGSSHAAAQPLSPCVPAPTAIDIINRDASGIALPAATCAAAAAESREKSVPAPVFSAKATTQSPVPAAATVHEGARVRIEGLQTKPQANGRTGVVCGGFDEKSGRWTVAVNGSDAGPAFRVAIRPVNIVVLSVVDLPRCEAILRLLPNADAEVQRDAVAAICTDVSGIANNKDTYVIAGAASAICNLLLSPFTIVQERAAGCIAAMCRSRHVRSQDAFRDAGCMPLLVGLLSSPSADVQNWSCQALLQLIEGHSLNATSLCDVASTSDARREEHLFCPFISVLRSTAEGRLIMGVLQLMQRILEANHKHCVGQAGDPYLAYLERRGFSDAVIALQTNADGNIKRLANECVVTFGILKMVCGDVGADNHDVSAAACSRLRRTLQACICDAVADMVMDDHVPGHLARLLTSANTRVVDDSAMCIGLLSDWSCQRRHASKHGDLSTHFSELLHSLVGYDASVDVQCLHSILSVAASAGGSTSQGLVAVLERFLLTYGNSVIIRQLVDSHDILSICLDILRSSPTSECFHSVVSILQKLLLSEHSEGQVANATINSYITRLNTLGVVQVLQSGALFRPVDTVAIIDRVLHFFYKFLSLDEKLRILVSQRPVPPAPALQFMPQSLISSSLRGDLVAVESHSGWVNVDKTQRIVRFFVSSTFDDTKHERDALIKCVLPAAQCYARAVGFEVVMSEMRFGIRKGLTDDHKTTEVCMAELQRCVETSAGLSYVLLSCNRSVVFLPAIHKS